MREKIEDLAISLVTFLCGMIIDSGMWIFIVWLLAGAVAEILR